MAGLEGCFNACFNRTGEAELDRCSSNKESDRRNTILAIKNFFLIKFRLKSILGSIAEPNGNIKAKN